MLFAFAARMQVRVVQRPMEGFLSQMVQSSSFGTERMLSMNDLQNIPGARKTRKRVGRGPGSGLGKMSGYGHQKARTVPRGYEGGQTKMVKRLPKIGFVNALKRDIESVSISDIQDFINLKRLHAPTDDFTTIRDLYACGVINKVRDGVKVLDVRVGGAKLTSPIHLEVNQASLSAINAIEAAGGTVTCIHLNKLAMRAILKPYKFDLLPMRARPPPKLMDFYLDKNHMGYLSPEVQIRNLKLFGAVTSEPRYRAEHTTWMDQKRAVLKASREQLLEQFGPYKPKNKSKNKNN